MDMKKSNLMAARGQTYRSAPYFKASFNEETTELNGVVHVSDRV